MPKPSDLPPVPAAAIQLIEVVRDTRFANGRVCAHCRSARVVLWGGFRGRKRYRCRSCNRTFSDLTKTPYSYSKKPELWAAYQDGMRSCRKLRPAAADLGIHVSTAFRWRHAILRRMRRADDVKLAGWTEFVQLSMAYSAKGTRMGSAARRRGSGSGAAEWQMSAHVHLLVAQSRSGPASLGIMAIGALHARLISAAIEPHTNTTMLLRASHSPPWRRALEPHPHLEVGLRTETLALHLRNAIGLRNQFVVWLEQFKGVATKYLSNYLAWHRLVDLEIPGVWSRRITLQCSGGTPFS